MIIGLTGMPASGSDLVGRLLVEKGFIWLSYSDILRDELVRENKEVTRKNLQDLGNALRDRHGHGVLSERLLAKMEQGKHYVVGTLRNPAEVMALRKASDFVLVHVQASQKIRFSRLLSRARLGDPKTAEEFSAFEAKESGKGEAESGIRISDCIALADHTLVNEGTVSILEKNINELLTNLNINP